MRSQLFLLAAAVALSACTTVPNDDPPGAQRIYHTGSNIPARERSSASEVTTADPAAVQDALRRRTGSLPGGKGN